MAVGGTAVPGASRQAALCWGQRWSWNEQQVPVRERTASLMLSRIVDAPGARSPTVVRDAARLVISRHESLHSTFAVDGDGSPRQYVWPTEGERYSLKVFDREVDCLFWLRQPADLTESWPLRIGLLRSGAGPERLGVATHHVAADLYGFDVLCQELVAAIGARARGAEARLPPIGRQPVDLAEFEQSPAGAAVNARAIGHWLRHDDDLGEVLGGLRARFLEPSDVMYVARVVSTRRQRLIDLAKAEHGSEAAVAVAAVAGALAGHLRRNRIPLTMYVSNRHLAGLRRSVSCVTQSGLLSVQVPDPRTIEAVIPRAWSGMLDGMRYAYYDGDELSTRMRSLDSGGRHSTIAPPSINIVRAGATLPEVNLRPRPDLDDGRFTSWAGQGERRCLSLYFHVQASAAELSVELRAGAHLLSMLECHQLAADAMRLITG